MKIPLIRGRLFDASDRVDGPQVAIVSASLARAYWGDNDPIGKRFKLAIDGPWITVVGVSGDVVHNWFVRQFETVYRPLSQTAPYSVAFAVRTVGDPNALAGDLRRAVSKVDADQPIASLATLDTLVEERAAGFAFIARALGVVGAIALVLSLMGIYSLMAFLTAQRTQEIGVRMALGAGKWQVIRATTTRALAITIAGSVIGAALAFALGRAMQAMLFGLVDDQHVAVDRARDGAGDRGARSPHICRRRAAAIDPMSALPATSRHLALAVRPDSCRRGRTLSPELQPRRRQHSPVGARRVTPAAPARLDARRTGASRRGSRRSPAPPARSCSRGWCGACRSR